MEEIKKVQLGTSDLWASEISLGGGNFGRKRRDLNCDENSVHSWLDYAVDCGINLFDMANIYPGPVGPTTFGIAETILGNWLKQNSNKRSDIIVATKLIGLPRPGVGEEWLRNGRMTFTKQDIIDSCNDSLKRLQVDCIDLYQLHWPTRNSPAFGSIPFQLDPTTNKINDPAGSISILEQLEAFDSLVRAGKIRAFGLVNETAYGVHEFASLARQYGLVKPTTLQNQYSLTDRSLENGLHETTKRLDISVVGYSALNFGLLTGTYDDDYKTSPHNRDNGRMSHTNPGYLENKRRNWATQETFNASFRYNQLARKHGMTPTELALAFCYNSPWTTVTLIGATNLNQLKENLSAYGKKLDQEILNEINAIRREIRDPAY